ncbi:hypothetical protein B0T19DRAFT_3600 [Cercophora scortea]|uniref:Nephrocystin 3-like N-terminal domain-containing protein n=1 Tax=Cercophora scortea TaxID=314031 RepID=A0AAE0J1K3_9PEZI|nr:hypothetical protein B0T19DRAFT_3600 [Cercophora scortea]
MSTSKALATPRSLSPELRLAQAVSEFAQGLDDAGKQRFRQLQVQLASSAPTLEDVIKLTEDLNREGQKRHASWRPATGTRMGGFLRRIQQFAAFGDILIGGGQNLIASGVWTAVRSTLEATIGYFVYFDHVSTLLMRLTTSWSIAQDFAHHFPSSTELQTYLVEYLIRVVRLCQKIILFSKRSATALLAASLFSSFELEFQPAQQELDQWGLLIEKKFASLSTQIALEGHAAAAKRGQGLRDLVSRKARQQHLFGQQRGLLNKLSPDQGCFESVWRRERKKGSCVWLLDTPSYKSWKSGEGSTLLIAGHLGSGKTVALANIAADVTVDKNGCSVFFCKQEDPSTLKSSAIIGSIAYQMIQSNLTKCSWEKLDKDSQNIAVSTDIDSVTQFLPLLLPREKQYFVVVDGLEDCPTQELEETMQTLQRLGSRMKLRLCFSCRLDSKTEQATKRILVNHRIFTNDARRDTEIHNFIKTEVTRRNSARKQPLGADLESQIVEQLTLGAQGMYLWVALQLEAIFPTDTKTVTTNETVLNILGHLPESLPDAFNQALSRISDKRYGGRIFELVAVAATPLTGDQLRVAVAVDPGNTTWESGRLPHNSRQLVASCGGSLLEIDEEDSRVRFIHHSVLTHLVSSANPNKPLESAWIDEADKTMGSICVTYLNYGIFDTRVAVTQNIDGARVVNSVKEAAVASSSMLVHVIRHIKRDKHRVVAPSQMDIVRILRQAEVVDNNTMECFLPYARLHWLRHTKRFHADSTGPEYQLWRAVLEERSNIVDTPWEGPTPGWEELFDYANKNNHGCLYQYMLRHKLDPGHLSAFAHTLNLAQPPDRRGLLHWLEHETQGPRPDPFEIEGPWLDDSITRCLATGERNDEDLSYCLLSLGASPVSKIQAKHYGLTGIDAMTALLTVIERACHHKRVPLSITFQIIQNAYKALGELMLGELPPQNLGFNRNLYRRLESIALVAAVNDWDDAINLLTEFADRLPDSWIYDPDSESSHFADAALEVAVQRSSVSITRALVGVRAIVTHRCKGASRKQADDAFAPFMLQLPIFFESNSLQTASRWAYFDVSTRRNLKISTRWFASPCPRLL